MKVSVQLFRKNDKFVATCQDLEISCYGSSRNEAVQRFKKVLSFYMDSAKELGLDVESFDSLVVEGKYSGKIQTEDYSHLSKMIN